MNIDVANSYTRIVNYDLTGSETYVTTTRDVTRLEAAEMRFLRSINGYTRLEKIRKELEISGIKDLRSKQTKMDQAS